MASLRPVTGKPSPLGPLPAQTLPETLPTKPLYGPGAPGTWSGDPAATNGSAMGSLANPTAGYTSPSDLTGHTFLGHAPAATPYGDFVAPNPANVSNDPYYQFRAAEGQKALEHSAAARGTLIGGGQLKALERYRQGLASEEAGHQFDRALAVYNANKDTNAQNFGQSTTQMRGDLDIFGANNRTGLEWAGFDRAGEDGGSASASYVAPQQTGLSDYAAMVAQLRQQQQQRAANPPQPPANNRPGWIDRNLDVPSYRGPSTGGGIGRRAL